MFAVVEEEVGISDEADVFFEVCAVLPDFSGLLADCCYQNFSGAQFCRIHSEFEGL